jgi:Flp pilus assembly protein TadD
LEGITANPHNSYNYNALGVVYNSMGWHQRAVSEFDRAIALNPAEADFHYNLALAHKQLKHIDAAER